MRERKKRREKKDAMSESSTGSKAFSSTNIWNDFSLVKNVSIQFSFQIFVSFLLLFVHIVCVDGKREVRCDDGKREVM